MQKNERTSKTNQARMKINFPNLKKSQLKSLQNLKYIDDNKLIKYLHDEAIGYLNSFTEKGYLLPLKQMNLILKKFQSQRYGDIEDAEQLYSAIREKLHNYSSSTENQYSSDYEEEYDTHYEMMETYIRRLAEIKSYDAENYTSTIYKFSDRIIKIFDSSKSPQTCYSLMHFYAVIAEVDKIIDLYNNNPNFRNEWIYEIYIDAINRHKGINIAAEEYQQLCNERKITGNRAHIKIIELHEKNANKAEELFSSACEYDSALKDDEYLYRALLKVYVKSGNTKLDKIIEFFQSIPHKIEPTYNCMIEALHKVGRYDEAFEIYKQALENQCYKKNKPTEDSMNSNVLKVDLHSHFIMGGGSTTNNTALNEGVRVATLKYLFEELYNSYKQKSLSVKRVEIICGKGKNAKTKNSVKDHLCKKYNLKIKPEDKKLNTDWDVENDESNSGAVILHVTPELIQKLFPSIKIDNRSLHTYKVNIDNYNNFFKLTTPINHTKFMLAIILKEEHLENYYEELMEKKECIIDSSKTRGSFVNYITSEQNLPVDFSFNQLVIRNLENTTKTTRNGSFKICFKHTTDNSKDFDISLSIVDEPGSNYKMIRQSIATAVKDYFANNESPRLNKN